MNAIPARVAGVERLVVVTPTPKGQSNPIVLAAAHIAGVDEIWRVGGAQAVGALAYGTQRIRPVDVITGPGNAWVAEAKRQLFGVVGIDMVAGPSEILVIADGSNDPEWIAADLLSQAEHDPTSQSILITDDAGFARQVEDCIDLAITQLATGKTARTSWDAHGVMIVVNDLLAEAPALANRLAAEHVELAVDDPEPYRTWAETDGAVLCGLDGAARQRLARWVDLLAGATDRAPGQTWLQVALDKTLQELVELPPDDVPADAVTVVHAMDDAMLAAWMATSDRLTHPPNFIDQVSPGRWLAAWRAS
jgi:histidinol dehydrogenase